MEESTKHWRPLTIRLSPEVYALVRKDAAHNSAAFHGKSGILIRAIVNAFYGMGDGFALDMIQENIGRHADDA
jgi:hypothetical protein